MMIAKNIKISQRHSFLFISMLFCTVILSSTQTDALSWADANPSINQTIGSRAHDPNATPVPCQNQTVTINNNNTLQSGALCVTKGKNLRYSNSHVSLGSDTSFYSKGTSTYTHQGLIPNTDSFIMWYPAPSWSSPILAIIKNTPSQLQRNPSPVSYTFNQSYDFIFRHSGNVGWKVGRYLGFSENGKWIAAEVVDVGLVRINTDTFEVRRFSTDGVSYSWGNYPDVRLAVSNDGTKLAMGHNLGRLSVYDITANCGDVLGTNYVSNQVAIQNPCPSRNISSYMTTQLGSGYDSVTGLQFNSEGNELTYATRRGTTSQTEELVTLRRPGYVPAAQIDYLAMGDSYSSGEGDTERNPATNQKFYREYTDKEKNTQNNTPREKCHVSTRSYPYKLALGMQLGQPTATSATSWQSVACSGATAWDVKEQGSSDYKGQGDRLKDYDVANFKNQALNEFIPGRQKQIEFVKKYKPKVITLTMGGNDIGFAQKIESCANPSNTTCYTATQGARPGLARQIRDQYDNLRSLYHELYEASGKISKIYVLGYPEFINSTTNASCGSNIGNFEADEKVMIGESIRYLNRVISKAAHAVGVKYIDIEDSLEGGRLCDEGQKYMTGITGLSGWNGNQLQESFHPNAKGNFEIAMDVWDQVNHESLIDYDVCPNTNDNICPDSTATKQSIQTPTYFQTTDPGVNVQYEHMTSGETPKSSPLTIKNSPYSFRSGSNVQMTLHSDPVDLGLHQANTDGSLEEVVTVPSSVPVGYHTLVLTGETYSGEPLRVEQVIFVKGDDPEDIDDDNIADDIDACLFVDPISQDADYDGIDDACDPAITDPVLYFARNGDVSLGEDPAKLYLFRNTRASSVTGITTDHTEPNSFSALVGASITSQTEAIFNKFVMLEDDNDPNIRVPTILAKDGAGQCIALQAQDHLTPSLSPTDPAYVPRELIKLTQLPEGEECE